MNLNESIEIMKNEIVSILIGNEPTIYLFGSVALGDFKFGWSDIDILVLTLKEITEQQAETLVGRRQVLLERYPGNPYFRLFEGGMISADAFLHNNNERTVYWGTIGQRITDSYQMDSFVMAELLDCGILLYGEDIRNKMAYPAFAQMRDDIVRHVQSARKHGVVVGWLLDIARGIYTLRTGKIIAKTDAGEWALDEKICPDADVLQKSVQIRKEPLRFSKEDKSVDNAVIQRFADVLQVELANTVQHLAESELQDMGIPFNTLSLIRNKDGVSVWRVTNDADSYVMKCIDKPEYRREITNYQILSSLGVPTLKVTANTDYSLLIEDIEQSVYRLGTVEDINDPITAKLIARWYKTLHENGREYANTYTLYDECDSLTLENLRAIQEKTGTQGLPVWRLIEEHFAQIQTAAMSLQRTITYNDFHFTNLAVLRDGSAALLFDYNMLGKGYMYSDIRNVCGHLGNEEAKAMFQVEYGPFDEAEKLVDDVVCVLTALHNACQSVTFPSWGNVLLSKVENGGLLTAVEKLLESESGVRGEFKHKASNQESDKERQSRIYPILLSEYNPAWAEWFTEEKANLERLIGVDNIARISHFGSTSVPGLTAKPTVDILLEIKADTTADHLITALPSPEYICLNPPDMPTPPPHLMFLKGYLPDGFAEKVYHIHVRYLGDPDEFYFRDHLIAHPDVAAEYAALKRRLFQDYEHDRNGYTAAKTDFIRSITKKAKEK